MSYLSELMLVHLQQNPYCLTKRGNCFSNSSEYELIQPRNGWAQQRPNDWKNATLKTLKSIAQKVNSDEIKGIGVSGQMHGLVVLDENNDVLYDSIIWCDQRTEKEVIQIIDTIGKERYIDLTLNAPNTSFTLSKLLWLKNNEPDIFQKYERCFCQRIT